MNHSTGTPLQNALWMRLEVCGLCSLKRILTLALGLFFTLPTALLADDSRVPYSLDSPTWLASVGALSVPTQKYEQGRWRSFFEDCSATLVGSSVQHASSTIVTAWHCLEHYTDVSRAILFTLHSPAQGSVSRSARILRQGGGMHADWAILKLDEPIPIEVAVALSALQGNADKDRTLAMAGFSRDAGLGENGARLTFDPACRITTINLQSIETDCYAYKGASGGAVVQVSGQGEMLYAGVISEGDSEGLSRFVPVDAFRAALHAELH